MPGTAVVKLTHEQQEMLASAEPAIFAPVPGGWGRQGWTRVMLAAADELTLRSALLTAWRNVAPASLRKAFDVRGNEQPKTTDAKPAGPLASPGPWNMVAEGYEEITRKFLEAFSRSGLAMLGYGSDTSAIDVACGPGTTTLLMAPAVRHVTSVDFSAAMLDQLRRNVAAAKAANVEIVEADGQALPFPDGSFDVGVSMFGLMFFPGPGQGICRAVPGSQARWRGTGVELGAGRTVAIDAHGLCRAAARGRRRAGRRPPVWAGGSRGLRSRNA